MNFCSSHPSTRSRWWCGFAIALYALTVQAADTTPAQQLQRWEAQAGQRGNAARGQSLFESRHATDVACTSCHGQPPTQAGKHASTGKPLPALAPAHNPAR